MYLLIPFYVFGFLMATGSMVEGAECITISDKPGSYEAWPSIALGIDGQTLYAVYRISDNNIHMFDRTGRIVLKRSKDYGKTWSDEFIVSDMEGIDDRNPAILTFEAKTGKEVILVAYNTFDGQNSRAYVRKSEDGGRSWTDEVELSGSNERRTRGKPCLLSNGQILIPLYDVKNGVTYVVSSVDGGDTWSGFTVTTYRGDETSILELKDGDGRYTGRVYGLIRDNQGKYWETISNDYGRTWCDPKEVVALPVFRGTPVELLRLSDDRVVAVYTYGRDLVVSLSADECKTWGYRHVVFSGASVSYYPSAIQLGDGRLYIVWCTNASTSDIYGCYAEVEGIS